MAEKNYYKEAKDALLEHRREAEFRSEAKLVRIYSDIPEIEVIDKQIAALSIKLFGSAVGKSNADAETVKAEMAALRQHRSELLQAAGYSADYTDLKFTCEICRDTGFTGLNMCSCLKRKVAEKRLADSDMGPLSSLQTFDNFDLTFYNGENRNAAQHARDCLMKFAECFNGEPGGDSWLLMGATGLGKTHLSTATGVAVIKQGFDVVYKSAQSMVDDFEAEQFHNADRSVIEKYYNCDLLIIDDLGTEMNTQFNIVCLYNVINNRMNAGKSTIFSTNLTQRDLRGRYEDRITSRLFGICKPIVFGGVDIRHQKIMRK